MGFDAGAVASETVRCSGPGRRRREQARAHAFLTPARLTVGNGFSRAVLRRAIRPAESVLDDVNNAAQHPPVMHTRPAAHIVGPERLALGKLLLAEPE